MNTSCAMMENLEGRRLLSAASAPELLAQGDVIPAAVETSTFAPSMIAISTTLHLTAVGDLETAHTPKTITATVTADDDSIPTGWVYFMRSGLLNGSKVLGRAQVDANGEATIQTEAELRSSAGYSAVFLGDPGYTDSTFNPVVALPPGFVDDISATWVDPQPAPAGQPIQLSANVMLDPPIADGIARVVAFRIGEQFYNGTVPQGGGLTTATLPSLPAGTYQVEAYLADAYRGNAIASLGTRMLVVQEVIPDPTIHTPLLTGDFDGNGQPDQIYRLRADRLTLTLRDDAGDVFRTISLPNASDSWNLEAVGDINGNGDADLLWRNTQTNRAYAWMLEGGKLGSQAFINAGGAADGWRMVGAGDFNGDGKADLVWTNDLTHKQAVWHLDGVHVRGVAMFNHALRQDGWILQGVQDIDEDGDADLLWRNTETGSLFAWLVDGTRVVGGRAV